MKANTIKLIMSSALLALASTVHAAGGGLGCGGGGCPGGGSGGQGAGLPSSGNAAAASSTQGPRIHGSPNAQTGGAVTNGGQGSGMSRDTGGTGMPGAKPGKPSPVSKNNARGAQGL
ncbi:hypothetical protein [Caballeronia sp. ATUFL_M2_KS44]|uniref:hypothetical protein n=1 Tax=Caballeronia sp. ATUFL_M2_KS44 TaxID=2921767 RepID=UPI002027A85D|nr:hypothetical protein [Caballeronia sp. ATUFL_M2_KS44]